MEFNIGDSVRIKETGDVGKVTDKMFSEAQQKYFYDVEFSEFTFSYEADELDPVNQAYHYTIERDGDIVVAVLYEGEKAIGRGHGHVMHDGIIGFAQAASYALKRIYMDMNAGKMIRYNAEEDRYE